jgi:hypothetical protein
VLLRLLIAEHLTEVAYDFRTRFNLSAFEIGHSITWQEVTHLVSALMKDPSSWTQAARSGWKHPVSFEWMVLANTYDVHTLVNSKRKPKPYPTPWADKNKSRIGATNQDRSHVEKMLERMNPKE